MLYYAILRYIMSYYTPPPPADGALPAPPGQRPLRHWQLRKEGGARAQAVPAAVPWAARGPLALKRGPYIADMSLCLSLSLLYLYCILRLRGAPKGSRFRSGQARCRHSRHVKESWEPNKWGRNIRVQKCKSVKTPSGALLLTLPLFLGLLSPPRSLPEGLVKPAKPSAQPPGLKLCPSKQTSTCIDVAYVIVRWKLYTNSDIQGRNNSPWWTTGQSMHFIGWISRERTV